MILALKARLSSLSCAYCLSLLAEVECWSCWRCGARLHHDCADELGSCPSVGCCGSPRTRQVSETPAEAAARRAHLAEARDRRERELEAARSRRLPRTRRSPRRVRESWARRVLTPRLSGEATELGGPAAFFGLVLSSPATIMGYLTYGPLQVFCKTHHLSAGYQDGLPLLVAVLSWLAVGLALTAFLVPIFEE